MMPTIISNIIAPIATFLISS